MKSCRFFKNQRGVTLLVVLFLMVVIGLAFGIAGSSWKTITQRAKEEQLLWVGGQYRRAIESYFGTAQAGVKATYPGNLEDLLKDPRFPRTVRHIRKLYKDPMTGEDFEPIRAGGTVSGLPGGSMGIGGASQPQGGTGTGGIIGVRSTSKEEPFKKDGFPEEFADFKNAAHYSDWDFIYKPGSVQQSQQGSQQPGGQQSNEQQPGNAPTSGQNPAAGNAAGQGGDLIGPGTRFQ